MCPVSCVSCASWRCLVNAADHHETIHLESGMRYQTLTKVRASSGSGTASLARSSSCPFKPRLATRDLAVQSVFRDIQLPVGGAAPLAPTRTSVRRLRAYGRSRGASRGRAISHRRTSVSRLGQHKARLDALTRLVSWVSGRVRDGGPTLIRQASPGLLRWRPALG